MPLISFNLKCQHVPVVSTGFVQDPSGGLYPWVAKLKGNLKTTFFSFLDLLGTEFSIKFSLCAGKFTPPDNHKRKL